MKKSFKQLGAIFALALITAFVAVACTDSTPTEFDITEDLPIGFNGGQSHISSVYFNDGLWGPDDAVVSLVTVQQSFVCRIEVSLDVDMGGGVFNTYVGHIQRTNCSVSYYSSGDYKIDLKGPTPSVSAWICREDEERSYVFDALVLDMDSSVISTFTDTGSIECQEETPE